MKKVAFWLGLFFLFSFFFCAPALSSAKNWHFNDFNSKFTINQDSTFWVEETIQVTFEGSFSQFWRTIPHKRLDYVNKITVTDLDTGKELTGSNLDITTGSGGAEVKIFSKMKNTTKNWQIKYLVHGGIGYFGDWDELYYNTVPADRSVRIDSAQVDVILPSEVNANQWKQKVYTETNTEVDFGIINDTSVRFKAENLAPQTNLTIVLGWPKGIVEYHRNRTKTLQLIGILIPIITLLIVGFFWWRKRQIKGRGTIAPEFVPPTEDPPILVDALLNERIGPKSLTATLINLARQGYLKIIEKKKKGFIGTKTVFKFKKLKAFDSLSPIEEEMAIRIFGSKDQVSAEDLKDDFYTDFKKIKKQTFEKAVERGWYKSNPETRMAWTCGCGIGALFPLVFIGIVIAGFWNGGLWITFGSVFAGLIVLAYFAFTSKKTSQGKVEAEKWLGFKMFLGKTERFKMADLEGKGSKLKELGTGVFEQYLPYALILGVDRNWTNRFKDLKLEKPDWYDGGRGHRYTPYLLYSSMSSLNTTASSTMLHSPGGGSGYGGGSGFGGGGGAGGGGGGGGAGAG